MTRIASVCLLLSLLSIAPPLFAADQAEALGVMVTGEPLSQRPIDLKQCGQFIEPLCNLIPSMTAQQVENTSFEEEPPFHVEYKRDLDKPVRPWYPDGSVHLAKYSFDEQQPFNGKRSLKIDLSQAQVRAGISQDGFYVREGLAYQLKLHMRAAGAVTVRASLHGGGGMAAEPVSLGRADDAWRPAEARLLATKTLDNATLTIDFEGPGTLWLDRVYLIGEDAVEGIWRADVAKALSDMTPGIVRFGGSTMVNDFEWDRCIGPWDARVPYTTCWGGLEPNFVGVEEFVQLCQHIGAEPLVCLRWNGKKPQDAAAEVEYFNGSAESTWGKVRARNGHPEPYKVKYWQIGNEVGGQEYDASIRAFAEAMRQADPAIKILSSFPSESTLKQSGGGIDYLCPHHYGCADLAGKREDFRHLGTQIEEQAGGRDVRIAVTEWNTTAGDWGLGRGMLQTLSNALACARYHNLMMRHANLVEIAIRSNLVDSFASGVIQTGPGWLYLAPTYHAQCLYARAAGSTPLRLEASSGKAWIEEDTDVAAALSPDKSLLRIYAVNSTDTPRPVIFVLAMPNLAYAPGKAFVLQDRESPQSAEAMNSRDDPGRIAIHTEDCTVSGSQFERTFAPYSLTLLELPLGAGK